MQFKILTNVQDQSQLERNSDGSVKIFIEMTKAGTMAYLRQDLDPFVTPENRYDRVFCYRPPEEVSSPESIASFAHKTLTLLHPPRNVDLDNWYEETQGEISSDVRYENGRTLGTIYVKGKDAIIALINGTREVSGGYTALVEKVDGVSPEGVAYQYRQSNIRMNHLALVPMGRAGEECAIILSDEAEKGLTQVLFCCNDKRDGDLSPITDENGSADSSQPKIEEKEIQMTIEKKETVLLPIGDAKIKVDAEICDSISNAVDNAMAKQKTIHDKELTAEKEARELSDAKIVDLEKQIADAKKDAPTRESFLADAKLCLAIGDTAKSLGITITDADTSSPRELQIQVIADKLPDVAKGFTK